MARSIYCSFCKLEKGPGRENESSCKPCKSQRSKERRAAIRAEKGLRPFGSGRKLECSRCGKLKENPKNGYCKECDKARAQEIRDKAKAFDDRPKGLCTCGQPKVPGRWKCQPCATAYAKQWRKHNGFTDKEIARKNELQREKYKSVSKGRIRRKGSLVNGEPVRCQECDAMSEGWCRKCDDLYEYRKEAYHHNDTVNLKSKVRALTRSLIKSGILVKQCCKKCQSSENVEAHHEDYTKPMEIIWLCRACHNVLHNERTTL